MKKQCLLLFLSIVTVSAFAQRLDAHLILSNQAPVSYSEGNATCEITRHPDETTDVNAFVCQKDITEAEPDLPALGGIGDTSNVTVFKSRYNGILEAGFYLGTQTHSIGMLDTYFISGRQWTPNLSFGIGTGLHYIYDPGQAIIPLFLDLRYFLSDKKLSPCLITDFGVNFDTQNSFETGIMAKLALGLRYKVSPKSALNLSLGFEIYQIDQVAYVRRNTGTVGLALGFSF
ncbi:MAG: hypothetical protein CVU06_08820 [Bacteroidetes bacterium HGW-Bacteroidetes-22]|nr:MAG: hypothetical protein CVU06_08820 [Bacteroidetes bacterium HGW-Bacteroidetes-22]